MAKRAASLEEIASEVGRLFGTTENHARKWLDQRQTLLEALSTVRDRANDLMSELGAGENLLRRSGKRKGRASKNIAAGPLNDTPRKVRGRRKISEQTRAKMKRAAQRRWAGNKKKAGGSKRGSLTSK
jgi:hypothetical protein